MFHEIDEVDQIRQTSCEVCGKWYWNTKGGQYYCPDCGKERDIQKALEKQRRHDAYMQKRTLKAPSQIAMKKGKIMWRYIVEHKSEGSVPYRVVGELLKAGLIHHKGQAEIMTTLENTGHLVYLSNGRVYPYKNLNTGEEF